MRTLLDTNILLRASQPGHVHHADAVAAPLALVSSGRTLCVGAQTIYEFLAIATKPVSENGLGMTHPEAVFQLNALLIAIDILFDTPEVVDEAKRLIVACQVTGKKVHDCHLAAAMRIHDVAEILTFNDADFRRFPHVIVLSPGKTAAGQVPA